MNISNPIYTLFCAISIFVMGCSSSAIGSKGDRLVKLMISPNELSTFRFEIVNYGKTDNCGHRSIRVSESPPKLIVVNSLSICNSQSDAVSLFKGTTDKQFIQSFTDEGQVLKGLDADEQEAWCDVPLIASSEPNFPQYVSDRYCFVVVRYGRLVYSINVHGDSRYPFTTQLEDLVKIVENRQDRLREEGNK